MDQAAILAALKAITDQVAALSKVVMAQPPAVTTETPEAYYLRMNPSVADHPYFRNHPKEHWETVGIHSGRPSMWGGPVSLPPPTYTLPTPVAQVPAPTIQDRYKYTPEGKLVWALGKDHKTAYNGGIIEPPIEADCPSGVKTSKGRWVSAARADLGEMFMGYCVRISWQLDREQEVVRVLGSLGLASSPVFIRIGGFKEDGSNWHEAADRLFHYKDYLSEKEAEDKKNSDAAWDNHWKKKEEELRRMAESLRPPPAPVAPPPLPVAPPPEEEVPIE